MERARVGDVDVVALPDAVQIDGRTVLVDTGLGPESEGALLDGEREVAVATREA